MMRVRRRLSVAYIGPKSRTERLRKIKIGTGVAHITRDSDITFKVKRSKVNLRGEYCGGFPHSLLQLTTFFIARQHSNTCRARYYYGKSVRLSNASAVFKQMHIL